MAEDERSQSHADLYPLALKVGRISVWDWDLGSDTAVWSPTWTELLGRPVEDLPTTLEGSLELVHPDDRLMLERHLDALMEGAAERQAEYRLRHADGSWRWVRGSASMVLDDDGESSRLVLVVVDGMPERRALEAAEYRRRLEEVGRRSAARLIAADAAEIESTVTAGLGDFAELLGGTRAALVIANEQTGTLSDRLAWTPAGRAADARPLEPAEFPWLMGELSAGRVVSVASRRELPAEADDALRLRLEEFSAEAVLVVPLIIDGQVAAAIKLMSTEPVDWPAEGEAMLGAFADSCVQALRRRRLETELSEAHGHLRHLVDRSPVIMWRIGHHGNTLAHVSERTKELLGYPLDELQEHWAQHLHPDDVDAAIAALAQARAGHEVHHETRFRHADGRWFTFENFLRPDSGEDGTPGGALCYSVDVTDRKIAEEQLRRAQQLEAIGQLAGGVAHDFNNLLAVIYGYIELAQHGDPTALDEALAAAERARLLVDRLLSFSRHRDVEAVSVDLNATIRSMQRMVALIGCDIDVELDLADDLPPVTADVGQLEQAILNLAVNARDAMPTGGTLTLRTDVADREILPADLSGGRYVRLQIADTGIGMPPEVAARAVDPFFTTKANGHGTGLGLPAVHGAVTAVGGSLRFETTPGEGTTFDLFLPLASQPPQPSSEAPPVTTGDRTGATVLVVEDQPHVGNLVAKVLGLAGHHVLVAPDGTTALELAHGRHLDLVVTDVAMPQMTGPELVGALRIGRPDLPAIYMSGYTGESLPADERSWFLQKPFTIDQLNAATAEALHRTAG